LIFHPTAPPVKLMTGSRIAYQCHGRFVVHVDDGDGLAGPAGHDYPSRQFQRGPGNAR
jgi:hypothetical protein